MNQGSDKKCNEENSVFIPFRLIFYYYLLLFVNELRVNILRISTLRISKNENIDKTMISMKRGVRGKALGVSQDKKQPSQLFWIDLY